MAFTHCCSESPCFTCDPIEFAGLNGRLTRMNQRLDDFSRLLGALSDRIGNIERRDPTYNCVVTVPRAWTDGAIVKLADALHNSHLEDYTFKVQREA